MPDSHERRKIENIEYRTRNRRISKESRTFDLEEQRQARREKNTTSLHHSKFLVRYLIFDF